MQFFILTAAEAGEVREARWDEFDFENEIWSLPAERMQPGRPHRVPLSEAANDIIIKMMATASVPYACPGQTPKKPLSNMAFSMLLRRIKRDDIAVHGFRSTFRDWAAEQTDHPREIAEAALAHVVGDATERAYRRGDALEKRRALLDDWAAFSPAHRITPDTKHRCSSPSPIPRFNRRCPLDPGTNEELPRNRYPLQAGSVLWPLAASAQGAQISSIR